ncbi:ATP-binding protein [Streptomyces xanthochromogenes]|uniref:ATP-binding protein n=1 Tax=Streptomyces xanthochromogenes TaxID=67384 RepID=UPI003F4D7055
MSTSENEMREKFYPRERQSVPAARKFATGAVADWGFFHRLDGIALCVSELATNALLHGVPPGRGFLLRMRLWEGAVLRVEVHDSGGGVPRVTEGAAGTDEGGRGLVLVAALADKWGVGNGIRANSCGVSSFARAAKPRVARILERSDSGHRVLRRVPVLGRPSN